MGAKEAMTATVASDKETKNTRRFTIPQEDMAKTGFSGSVYLGKDAVAAGKKVKVTVEVVD